MSLPRSGTRDGWLGDRGWLRCLRGASGRALFGHLERQATLEETIDRLIRSIGLTADDVVVEGADRIEVVSLLSLALDLAKRPPAHMFTSPFLRGMFVSNVEQIVRDLKRERSLMPLDAQAEAEAHAPIRQMEEWATEAGHAHRLILRDLRAHDYETWDDTALGAKRASVGPNRVMRELCAYVEQHPFVHLYDQMRMRLVRRFEHGIKASYFEYAEMRACREVQAARTKRDARRARRHLERHCGDSDYEPLAQGFALLNTDAFLGILLHLDVASSAALVCCCRDFSGRDWPERALRATDVGKLLVSTLPRFSIRRIPGELPALDGNVHRRATAAAMPHYVLPSVDARGRRVLTDCVCSERLAHVIVDFGVRRPRATPLRDGLRDVDRPGAAPDRLVPCEDQPGYGTRPADHSARLGPWPDTPRDDLLRLDHYFRLNWAAADGPREALDAARSFERVPWTAYFVCPPRMHLFLVDGESFRKLLPSSDRYAGQRAQLLASLHNGHWALDYDSEHAFSVRRSLNCGGEDKCKPYLATLPARISAHVLATTGAASRRRHPAQCGQASSFPLQRATGATEPHYPKTLRFGVRVTGQLRPARGAKGSERPADRREYTTTIYSEPFVTLDQKRAVVNAAKKGLAACEAAGVGEPSASGQGTGGRDAQRARRVRGV